MVFQPGNITNPPETKMSGIIISTFFLVMKGMASISITRIPIGQVPKKRNRTLKNSKNISKIVSRPYFSTRAVFKYQLSISRKRSEGSVSSVEVEMPCTFLPVT